VTVVSQKPSITSNLKLITVVLSASIESPKRQNGLPSTQIFTTLVYNSPVTSKRISHS